MPENASCSVPGSTCSPPGARIYHEGTEDAICNAHYLRERRYGSPTAGGKAREPVGSAAGFVAMALVSETDACILWPFGLNGDGYGGYWVNGRTVPAHKYALEQSKGEAPSSELMACHEAGIGCPRACINPRHLDWGDNSRNQMDRHADGTAMIGERNHRTVLTPEKVREIRQLLADDLGTRSIAKRFGVSRGAIEGVKNGTTWAWLV